MKLWSSLKSKNSKALTGIAGLDEITHGGFPRGRSTLVSGAPGCGKTLLAMQFIVNGALLYNEPGVFLAFEETEEELAQNFWSLGIDIPKLQRAKKILIDYVRVDRNEIEETGEYNLEGLFIRLANAVDSIDAKRVALDTVEVLFGSLSNIAIVRSELRRLLGWLKDRGLTAIVTGEKANETLLSRFQIEEYVSDCVLVLDHRVNEQISTRRLRVVKYRGSLHGTDEHPFLIDQNGISLRAISALSLNHRVSKHRISSGIEGLDVMMEGKGYYRGSIILVTGTSGTGKTSIAAHFAEAACKRGEKCLFFAFEESQDQIVRNMRSIGVDLNPAIKQGLLRIRAERGSLYGLEPHLINMCKRVEEWRPSIVILDPVSNFIQVGSNTEVKAMLARLLDFLKTNGITALLTNLTAGGAMNEATATAISSLMDTWILLSSQDTGGMRDRRLYILKSRGMAHSSGVRQFLFTPKGIVLQ